MNFLLIIRRRHLIHFHFASWNEIVKLLILKLHRQESKTGWPNFPIDYIYPHLHSLCDWEQLASENWPCTNTLHQNTPLPSLVRGPLNFDLFFQLFETSLKCILL